MREVALGIIVAAAVLQGSFMVPMAYVKGWKWENSWLLFSLLGMFVFNWAVAFATVPRLCDVYQEAFPGALAVPVVSGVCWGFGAICFGVGVAATGFARGYAVIMGVILLGTVVPMVTLLVDEVGTARGILTLCSLVVMVAGFVICGVAGVQKEREQGTRTGAITRVSTISPKVGLLICVLSGLFSCMTNVGFAHSETLMKLASQSDAWKYCAGNAVWAVLFTSGGLANLAYCGYLLRKNDSLKAYLGKGLVRNVLLVVAMSAMWIGSFILYGVGACMLGKWGTVTGWPVFIGLTVVVASLWGTLQGEWTGASAGPRRLVIAGTVLLLLAVLIIISSTAA